MTDKEKAAEEWAINDQPKHHVSSNEYAIDCFLAGFNACLKSLTEAGPEFDEFAALSRGHLYLDRDKESVCASVFGEKEREVVTFEQGAYWQHHRNKAQIAALKDKIKELEAKLKTYEKNN